MEKALAPVKKAKKAFKLIIVDDEKAIGRSIQLIFESMGYETELFYDPDKALDWFTHSKKIVGLLITDYMMPHIDGLELARSAKKLHPGIDIILMTGLQDAETEKKVREANLYSILIKPFDLRNLVSIVEQYTRE